jgi:hypothetical protein
MSHVGNIGSVRIVISYSLTVWPDKFFRPTQSSFVPFRDFQSSVFRKGGSVTEPTLKALFALPLATGARLLAYRSIEAMTQPARTERTRRKDSFSAPGSSALI